MEPFVIQPIVIAEITGHLLDVVQKVSQMGDSLRRHLCQGSDYLQQLLCSRFLDVTSGDLSRYHCGPGASEGAETRKGWDGAHWGLPKEGRGWGHEGQGM